MSACIIGGRFLTYHSSDQAKASTSDTVALYKSVYNNNYYY